MNYQVDVMIIGAQKAGTTSLHHYLGEHPQLCSHSHKEFSYFTDYKEFNRGFDEAIKKYFSGTKNLNTKKIICKNAGLYTRPDCLDRLYNHNPNCELILILRNPVERAYSSYLMEKNAGAIDFEFEEIPEIIKNKSKTKGDWKYGVLIEYGKYAQHIENIKKIFPEKQLTILLYEDLKQEPEKVCRLIFKKLMVEDNFIPDFSIQFNVTVKHRSLTYSRILRKMFQNNNPVKRFLKTFIAGPIVYRYGEALRNLNKTKSKHVQMDKKIYNFLVDYFKPYNEKLEKIIGRNLKNWNS